MESIIDIYHKCKLAIFITLLIPLLWFGVKAGWDKANTDFPNYYVSAQLLLHGQLNEAYDVQIFNKHIQKYNVDAQGLFVMYPPTTSLMMLYLTPFDLLTAKRIWLLISLVAVYGLVFLITKLINTSLLDAANITLLSGFNLYNDIMLGQVYVVMLFLIIYGWYAYSQQKMQQSGIAWGMVAAFKFLPLFFIPFLLYKKQFKITAILIFTFLLINLIALIVGGSATYYAFIDVFINNYIAGKVANETAMSLQYQSIEVFANLSTHHFGWSNNLAMLLKFFWKIAWLLLFLSLNLKSIYSKNFLFISVSSFTLLLLLFENGSASYHLLFCLFALVCFFKIATPTAWKTALLICFAGMGFLPVLVQYLNLDNLLLNFCRLWCLSLFAACFFIGLKKNSAFIK